MTNQLQEKSLEPDIESKINSYIGEFIYVHGQKLQMDNFGKIEGIESFNKGYDSPIRFYHSLPFFKKLVHRVFNDCLIIKEYLSFFKKDIYDLELWIPDGASHGLLIDIEDILKEECLLYIGRDEIIDGMRKHNNSYNIGLIEHVIENTK